MTKYFILYSFLIININYSVQVNKEYLSTKSILNISSDQMQQHPQNWSVAADSNNLLYFANTGRALQFDGLSWDEINIPGIGAYSLEKYKNEIFIGGRGIFGKLLPDSFNKYKFEKIISDKLKDRKYSKIIEIISNEKKQYFISKEYFFQKNDNSINVYKPKKRFGKAFFYKTNFYIRDYGLGLLKLVDDKLVYVNNTDFFIKNHLMFAIPYQDKMLFGTYNNGLFSFDGLEIKEFKSEVNNFLINTKVDGAIILNDNNIAISTRKEGLIIIDENGSIKEVYNKKNGIQSNHINSLFQDQSNNIWLALNDGISKVEYSSPFQIVDKKNIIDGINLSVNNYQNKIYIGTTNGLFTISTNNEIKKDKKINSIVWQLVKNGNRLFIASNNGLKTISEKNESTLLDINTYKIVFSKMNKNIAYLSTREGFYLLSKNSKKWTTNKIKIGNVERILSFVENKNDLWISTINSGVFLLKNFQSFLPLSSEDFPQSNIVNYNTTNSIIGGQMHIFDIFDYPSFTNEKGMFKFSGKGNSFIPDSILGNKFANGSRGVFKLVRANDSTIAIHSKVENFLAIEKYPNKYELIYKPFKRFKKEQVNYIYPDGDKVWFVTSKNIFSYNLIDKKNYDLPFKTLVRKVYINSDSLIYGGAALPENYKPIKLDFDNRNLRFKYAATFYEAEDRTEYQYKLDAYEKKWSDWTKETQKDYTNLSEGKYTFSVRAKNVYGTIGSVSSYPFNILPPYYRTIWAYLFYGISFLSFGYVIVKWRINKLENDKIHLENLVDEKTKEIKEQTEKLKELDKIKSRFFANISHEFRTPLTLILGPIEKLIVEDKTKERSKTYSMIHRNSRRLLLLINQLLDLSKLESGNVDLNLRKINIVKLVQEVSSLFESLAVKKNIELTFFSVEDNIQLYCDLDKIEKVLINLFSNAFKFTEKGKISSRIERKNENVIITISDTGIGIDENKLEKVFEHFYQTDNSTKRSFEGSGIGLSLVKEFIELHKGFIKATSNLNKGTEFIISLPIDNEELLLNSEKENVIEDENLENINHSLIDENIIDNKIFEAKKTEVSELDKNLILIVEDNADVREYLKENLQNDFNIVEAENGKDGLVLAIENIPDLIISDVMMPVMDGYEFCKKIKTNLLTSHIPLILLTAKAGENSVLEGLEYGANDYVTKPFNISILQSRINNLISLRTRLQDKLKSDLLLKPSEIKVSSFDEEFLTNLHNLIEEKMEDPELSIEELAEKLFMNRISLYRKIKALTGDSPSVFIRSFRLKRAVQLLEQKSGNVTEIAFQVGFTNSAYFTKCFREQFGRLPSDFLSN